MTTECYRMRLNYLFIYMSLVLLLLMVLLKPRTKITHYISHTHTHTQTVHLNDYCHYYDEYNAFPMGIVSHNRDEKDAASIPQT